MKKFMFSAIAMIAFVGSSMAADIADEEEKKNGETVDCVAVATAALDAADPNNNWGSARAARFYLGQYGACIKSTGQRTQKVN
jgi:hypothetical protein